MVKVVKVIMLMVTITIVMVRMRTLNLKEELAESHLLASEERPACRCDWGGVALGDHHHHNDDDTW